MSVRAAADTIHQALSDALEVGKIPTKDAAMAESLLKQLRQPVRVTLLGLPKSGKSTLANLLLNDIIVPEGISLPTTQFVRGETPNAELTLQDGRKQTLDSADPYQIAAAAPMFVEIGLPLPALNRISVLEVVAPATMQDQQRAMHWAAKRTDMALWCTQSFDRSEQALWDTMPDEIKDNGFMLLTHADQALARGGFEHSLDNIRRNYAYQFNKILPIATPVAIAARQPDGTVDKPMMQKSGALTLISSILRQVDMGLQSTVDRAEMLIATYANAAPNPEYARKAAPAPAIETPVAEAPVVETPVVEVPVAEDPVEVTAPVEPTSETAEPEQVAAIVVPKRPTSTRQTKVVEMTTAQPVDIEAAHAKQAPRPTGKSRPIPVEQGTAAEAPKANAPKRSRPGFMPKARTSKIILRAKPETCDAYDQAIAYLTKQGRALTQKLAANDDIAPNELMSASAENILWLSDYLEDLNIKDDPVLEKTRTRALDASELVQLMQIEKNDSAAIDAISLVIQLKRDLEAEIAISRNGSRTQAA